MKQMLWIIGMLVLIQTAAANNVVISQVLYNPVSETSSEAVELHNPTNATINISNWVIVTETSATDATMPSDTLLQADQYYLITDSGWSLTRDDTTWVLADHEEAITLANTDAGIALSNTTHLIDAVGWGNLNNIGAGLYQGIPHSGTSEGQSLQRINETNNNSLDFQAAVPNFKNSSSGQSTSNNVIAITVMVNGAFPVIESIYIPDEDTFQNGTQILPIPKQNKTVQIEAIVSDPNGHNDITTVAATVNNKTYQMQKNNTINTTTAQFITDVNFSYTAAAGDYSVVINATDNANFFVNQTTAFIYETLLSFEVDTTSLLFAALPGETVEMLDDANVSTNNVTLWNTGNSVLDMQLWGTNLTTESNVIDISHLTYTFNSNRKNMTTNSVLEDINITAGIKQPISFSLTIPLSTQPGNYSGSIYLNAVAS